MLKNHWLKLGIAVVVIFSLFVLFRLLHVDFSNVTVDRFKEKIHSFGFWGPVIYIIFYILRPVILFPAAVLSASAGVIWGLEGLIYLLIAANISAMAEFLIARYVARDFVEKLIKGRAAHIDQAIERRGFMTVLLIRLIPNVAWDIQNLTLGLTKVKLRDYVLATAIGILPGSFALVYFGASFISVITNPRHLWKIILACGLIGAIFYLQNFLRKKQNGLTK